MGAAYLRALASADPFASLRGTVATEVADGADREEIYESLRALRDVLQARGLDGYDDVVVDVMDCLTGFSRIAIFGGGLFAPGPTPPRAAGRQAGQPAPEANQKQHFRNDGAPPA